MHLVALCRWGAPLESELPWLAQQLGVVAYDLRLRIGGVLPVVLTSTPDAARAQAIASLLRTRGHGVVVCVAAEVPAPDASLDPREFELGPIALVCKDNAGRAFELPYAELQALVRTSEISSAQQTTTTVEKKLAIGRAVLSGGLMMSKKVEKSSRSESEAREQVLYVFRRGRREPVLFRETHLRYQGLGPQLIKSSTLLNFGVFIDQLRARAPGALYDARFLTHKRKAGISAVAGVGSHDRRIETSNASENELGAYLLARAHEENQL